MQPDNSWMLDRPPAQEPRGREADGTPLEAQWWAYHKAHPEVYAAFVRTAEELARKGEAHLSARAIFEYLRYRTLLDMRRAPGAQAYKVRNGFSPYYARLLRTQYPGLAERFRYGELRSARAA